MTYSDFTFRLPVLPYGCLTSHLDFWVYPTEPAAAEPGNCREEEKLPPLLSSDARVFITRMFFAFVMEFRWARSSRAY